MIAPTIEINCVDEDNTQTRRFLENRWLVQSGRHAIVVSPLSRLPEPCLCCESKHGRRVGPSGSRP